MREARYVSLIPRTTLHSDSEQVHFSLYVKTSFSVLRQKMLLIRKYPYGACYKELTAEIQSSDSGNRLAAIVFIAGISLRLQYK
jgi:hypothetical protein